MRTTGGRAVRGRYGKSVGRIHLARYGRRRSGCCTLVLHAGYVRSTAWAHDSGGGWPTTACLSTWLNGGVYPTQVAEWAGHTVDVLLRIYAKCVVGQDEFAKRRISEALRQD